MGYTPVKKYYTSESERLIYRPLTSSDIESWSPFFEDNPTERFLGSKNLGPTPISKATAWIEKQMWRKDESVYGQLAVIEKSSNAFIGLGGIIERENDDYEITYSFLPDFWGKGYGTELAVYFKEFAFENMDVPSVISMIHKENEASIHVARKNGMEISSETTFLEMPIWVFRVSR